MSYSNITVVNISLQTAAVSRQGFGTPLFAGSHVWFKERVRSYNNIEQVGEDVPTSSKEYAAAVSAFSRDIPPSMIKIGRREVDTITFTPEAVATAGQVYSITVVGTDDVSTTATFTTLTGSETATEVVTALKAGLAGVVGVTITGTTTIVLAKEATAPFAVNDISRLTWVTSVTETPADLIQNIRNEDDDWYFFAASDHTDSFVMAAAEVVETLDKQYFVGLQAATNLAAYSEIATDTMSKLRQNQYERTSAWYHDTADTTYPEMEYIAIGAAIDAGKVAWGNNAVNHSAAKNVTTGLPLSVTEKNNLVAKNANFTETVGGRVITRQGSVSNGKWIDEVRDRDFMAARTSESLQDLLINTPKLPYTDAGISKVYNTLETLYSRYIEDDAQPNILQRGKSFEINLPRRKDVQFADISARTLSGQVTLYLTGAILTININGTATYATN